MDEQVKPAKKKIYKRWWFWVLTVIVFFIIVGASGGKKTPKQSVPAASDNPSAGQQSTPAAVQPTPTAPQTLLNISGSGSKSTQKFTAAGDWDLNWSYDCSNFSGGQGNFIAMVYTGDGNLSFQNSGVNQLGKKDTGVEHYHTGGTFYLQVNSVCKWKIEVKG